VDRQVVQQLSTQGSTGFWILLRAQADLTPAQAIRNWTARGAFVVSELQSVAESSQTGLSAYLDAHHVPYRPFWIVNGIRVDAASSSVVAAVATRPEVRRIVPTWQVPLERGSAFADPRVRVQAAEWGIKNIGANKVWKQFGDRGEGVVVANVDTGVQYDHPALARQYRGNRGNRGFDHDYNWWDPAHVCPGAGTVPCDNVGHGTHTMGTMVGKDGVNKIGVAPRARWIAAKGCEATSCSDTALLSSGQFILAPTRLDGSDPRPGTRPDVVNNSWAADGSNIFYRDTVNAWVAAGIFPQFSGGSSGPSCGTVAAPGSYVNTYAAGAYNEGGAIASFSSRGPSPFADETKPNISAPGVNIRSSLPMDTYGVYSGTSMASPHVAGAVALIISRNPELRGDVGAVRSILDDTAVNVNDVTCGGTADDNNVFGEGRLNAFAAVRAAKTARKTWRPPPSLPGTKRASPGRTGGGSLLRPSFR
jgi:subtilisin family serine protease